MPEARLPFMAVSPNLRTNRKFVRLRRLLGNPSERDLVGSLVMLWSQVFNDSPSGDISSWSPEEVADCAGWSAEVPGTSGTFLGALITARFVVDGFVNDWYEWGGYLYKSRQEESDRKRRYREQAEQDRKQNAGKSGKPVPGTSAEVPGTSTLTNGTEPTEPTERNGTNGESPSEPAVAGGAPSNPPTGKRGCPTRDPDSTHDGEATDEWRRYWASGWRARYLALLEQESGPQRKGPPKGWVIGATGALKGLSAAEQVRAIEVYFSLSERFYARHPLNKLENAMPEITAQLNGKQPASGAKKAMPLPTKADHESGWLGFQRITED